MITCACYASVRRYVHVCGASPMEGLVQLEIFHLLMAPAVDLPMYAVMHKCKTHYTELFIIRSVYEEIALTAVEWSHQ